MQLEGKIILIGETQTFGEKGFRKRELVIETEDKYPQKILIEFIQDKCDLLDKYNVGQGVKVSININGREWVNPQGETKYFNSLNGWRIEDSENASGGSQEPMPVEEGDLPFG